MTGILMQLAVPLINKLLPSRPWVLVTSTFICLAAMLYTGLMTEALAFALGIGIYGVFNGLRNPMLNAIIADEAEEKEQGQLMGINQSYVSIGQTVGPAIAAWPLPLPCTCRFLSQQG